MKRKGELFMLLAMGTAIPVLSQETERRDSIQAAVVTDGRSFARETGLVRMDKGDLIGTPVLLGTPDVLRTISNLPGVASGMELFSGMYVHGGDGSDNLYLLDGVPLYQIGHMGGLFSAFNSDVVSSLDFYRSGFPARFGGRLSSVVDVSTEKGDSTAHHGSFSIGLIDGRFHIGGPVVKGKLTYDVALRRSWIDAVAVPVLTIINNGSKEKTSVGYNMTDFNASLCYTPSKKDRITFLVYAGGDAFGYEHRKEKKLYTDKEIIKAEDMDRLDVGWGNVAGSAAWTHNLSEKVDISAGLYYTRGYSDISYEIVSNDADADTVSVSRMREENANSVSTLGAQFRMNISAGIHSIETGLEYTHNSYMMAGNANQAVKKLLSSDGFSVYAEDAVEFGPAMLRAGLRGDYSVTGRSSFFIPQPRIGASVRLSDGLILKAAYTSMSQVQHLLCPVLADFPTNSWAPSTGTLRPEQSNQYSIGANWKPYLLNGWRFDLGLFYKSIENCIIYKGTTTVFPPVEDWEHFFAQGRGLAKGLEIECTYTNRVIDCSLYYTLSETKRLFQDIYPEWFPDRFDNRHKITLTGSVKLTDRIVLSALWNYHSGNRVSLPTHYAVGAAGAVELMSPGPYNFQLPAYHRLDIGCDFHRTTRKGREAVFNVSVCNVYNHKNAMMVMTDFTDAGEPGIKAWSLIPILPSFSYRIEF